MLGNVTITNSYVPTVGGVATYTVTCGADNSALTTGIGNASSSYWEAHEVSISEATAVGTAAGVSRPALDASAMATFTEPTDGGHNNTMNVSCDDAVSTYTKGAASTSFVTSANQYTTSTAGSLMSATVSAFDQYGAGIAGQKAIFQSVTTASATSVAASAVDVATLTTGADGQATLTSVVCATASGAASVAWNTDDTGLNAATDMHSMPATAAGSALSAAGEGTTVYCNAAMADGAYTSSAATARAVHTWTMNGTNGDFGELVLTICSLDGAETAYGVYTDTCVDTASMAGAGEVTATECQNAIRGASNVDAATTCTADDSAPGVVMTVTFPANTGAWSIATKTSTLAVEDGGLAIAVAHPAPTTAGVAANLWTFVDDDAATSTIVAKRTRQGATTAGAAVLTTEYHKFVHDSTDTFELDATASEVATAVQGASQAQFATELASLTDHTTPITVTQRTTAVTTTQVSHFRIGK